jgi:mono/diheme cytochrome c family protein
MLTKKIACPSCSVSLKVADSLAPGKRITCPKCGTGFPVPGNDDQTPPPRAAITRARKPAPPPAEEEERDEEQDERPVARKGRADRDDERDERPLPRKRRKKVKEASGNLPLILGGAVLLIGIAVVLAVVLWPSGKKDDQVAENKPPSGGTPGPGQGNRPMPFNPGQGNRPSMVNPQQGNGPGPDNRVQGNAPVQPVQNSGNSQQFAAGRKVYDAQNCARCHTVPGDNNQGGPPRGRKKDLSRVGANPEHTVAWLTEFIRNPKAKNPRVRMPAYEGKISPEDLRSLAEYLASLK